ncbi:MAG: DUF86 domain-containing protein [Clostridia bacterium]|jgi:uncharacterized protein YutE (UPF0331/DUF86 family)|nr:DUF86 domain-containing protein [Clostridia bacterium]
MDKDINREIILAKIAFIQEQVQAVQELTRTREKEKIIYDLWILNGLKYSLQTAIEAMIDIAYHASAKRFAHAPLDARDALRVLQKNNVINQDGFETYSSMIGFRNKIVHGYQEVSPERVYELATTDLGDFEKFICITLKLLTNDK